LEKGRIDVWIGKLTTAQGDKDGGRGCRDPATNSDIPLQPLAATFMQRDQAALLKFCLTNNEPILGEVTEVKFQSL
jgi:hypothetical protein